MTGLAERDVAGIVGNANAGPGKHRSYSNPFGKQNLYYNEPGLLFVTLELGGRISLAGT